METKYYLVNAEDCVTVYRICDTMQEINEVLIEYLKGGWVLDSIKSIPCEHLNEEHITYYIF